MANQSPPNPAAIKTEPCASGCSTIAVERNRYYTGRYMAARDFSDEQAYYTDHRHLHNRLLHGWGVVCGLEVDPHTAPECAKGWVVIRAGMALDCCGREIIVERDIYYELKHLKTDHPAPPAETAPDALPPAPVESAALAAPTYSEHRRFLLGLEYHEELCEYAPALYSENACDPRRTEANRVREGWRLVERDYTPDLRGTCWRDPHHNPEPACFDDCQARPESATPGGCLHLPCPCPGDMAPLALIEYDPNDRKAGFSIDMDGRRQARPAPDVLTHIVHINWPHGGEMRLSHLRDKHHRQLRVTFDRDLYDPATAAVGSFYDRHPNAVGINEWTFSVVHHQWEDGQYIPKPLFNDDDRPRIEKGRVAVFTIPKDLLEGRATIGGGVLHITLRCDFILDCHHRPVDGNHLRGRLRSGNGSAGGVFESWFYIEDDEAERRERERHEREYRGPSGGRRPGGWRHEPTSSMGEAKEGE